MPLGFFRDLLQADPDHARFDHVRLEGEVVGGHFGFVSNRRLVAWQGAVRRDLARSHFLTPLLYWADIRTACNLGLDAVDFGGCVGRDSLWDFKRRGGAQPVARIQMVRTSLIGQVHRRLADVLRRGRGGS